MKRIIYVIAVCLGFAACDPSMCSDNINACSRACASSGKSMERFDRNGCVCSPTPGAEVPR